MLSSFCLIWQISESSLLMSALLIHGAPLLYSSESRWQGNPIYKMQSVCDYGYQRHEDHSIYTEDPVVSVPLIAYLMPEWSCTPIPVFAYTWSMIQPEAWVWSWSLCLHCLLQGWRGTWRSGKRQRRIESADPVTDKPEYLSNIEMARDQQQSSSGRPPDPNSSASKLHSRGSPVKEERQALIRDSPLTVHAASPTRRGRANSSESPLRAIANHQQTPDSVFPRTDQASPSSSSPVHEALADSASPLYRSLSEIPKNLPPVSQDRFAVPNISACLYRTSKDCDKCKYISCESGPTRACSCNCGSHYIIFKILTKRLTN